MTTRETNASNPSSTDTPSPFAACLRRMLDETKLFTRKEWAKFLDYPESRIADWIAGKRIPKPGQLWMIEQVLRESSSVSVDILQEFTAMTERPARETCPAHAQWVGRTFADYLMREAVQGFLANLSAVPTRAQREKILFDEVGPGQVVTVDVEGWDGEGQGEDAKFTFSGAPKPRPVEDADLAGAGASGSAAGSAGVAPAAD